MKMIRKVIQGRNPRISLESDEIEFIKSMLDDKLKQNQEFNRDKIYFLLKLYKKFEEAK